MTTARNFLMYKFRVYPKAQQHDDLQRICEDQRQLYNAALQERIDCYRKTGKSRSYMDQCKAVTELRKDVNFSNVPANLQRWTLKKIDNSYKQFFSRVRRGEKPGFPRYKGFHHWRSFGFAEFSGLGFVGNKIRFKGLRGALKVNLTREIRGRIKSCIFRRDEKGWAVCFQVAISVTQEKHLGPAIGIDVGLEKFATLSNGQIIDNPRIGKKNHAEIRRKQRAFARCKRNSKRRQKVKAILARAHLRIKNCRQDHAHKSSTEIVKTYGLIVVEDLKIGNMVKNHCFARAINDAAWGDFLNKLEYKAANAGARFLRVKPHNTSQICSGCGQIVRKQLSERIHRCDCGETLDRDINAARVILQRGRIVPCVPNVVELAASVHTERYVG